MTLDEKLDTWKEVGTMPDLFYFYKGYPVKAEFDYNNEVSYVATILTKSGVVFKTSEKSFEEDSKKAINKYLEENQPEYVQYVALVSGVDSYFNGSLPDIGEALISAKSLDDLRYELTSFALLALVDCKKPPKPSALEKVYEKNLYNNDVPLVISVEV